MPEKLPRRPVLLVILDGFGTNASRLNNAVAQANTPRFDEYFSRNPHTLLQASGPAVGLPDGQMGNSEVGHLTIGCGDVIRQDLVQIDDAIKDGSFYDNPVLLEAIEGCRNSQRPLHLLGLVSDGGVHSHVKHLLALFELCHRNGVRPVLHMVTDGRDSPPDSGMGFLKQIEPALSDVGGRIATVCGRYFAMDRDNRWDRTELAWRAIANGIGVASPSAQAVMEDAYESRMGDEFVLPSVVDGGEPLMWGDHIVFFNFRKDRARQLTSALFKDEFPYFDRGEFSPVTVTCMTEYDEWYRLPFAFKQQRPSKTLAEVISHAGMHQFHCAETEKYAHVTYFLNGGHGDAFAGEDRIIIESPKVATYDLKPEMSAPQVADAVIEAIKSDKYGFIVVNFANGDMVGHSGIPNAIIKAVESLDQEVGRVLDVACGKNCSVILTADHGNCEEMVDPVTGSPHTSHTLYPVPCMIIDEVSWQLRDGAGLSSIAPTVLQLLGLSVPEVMTGKSLLLKPVR